MGDGAADVKPTLSPSEKAEAMVVLRDLVDDVGYEIMKELFDERKFSGE